MKQWSQQVMWPKSCHDEFELVFMLGNGTSDQRDYNWSNLTEPTGASKAPGT